MEHTVHKRCVKGQLQSLQGLGGGVIQEGDKSVGWKSTGTVWEMVVNPGTALGVWETKNGKETQSGSVGPGNTI